MPPSSQPTIAEHLYWSYANLAMVEMAVHDHDTKYTKKHFMIRARLYAGLTNGTMSPRSLMRDQRIRMQLPQECVYCGSQDHLSIDHVVPTNRGGSDSGDNAIWACRTCNSSKSDRDLFDWWSECRSGFPPLFVVRIYLKQAIAYCAAQGLMDRPLAEVRGHPFSFDRIPTNYPEPHAMIFSPFHARAESGDAREGGIV
jgi:hypothetical protein